MSLSASPRQWRTRSPGWAMATRWMPPWLLWRDENALRVPIGALYRSEDGGWRVLVYDNGLASERTVRLGHVNDEFGEVLEGLSEGEHVVLNPGSSLAAETRIRARE